MKPKDAGKLVLLLLLLAGSAAQACSIVDQREKTHNNQTTVDGSCSNNGAPISCTYKQGDGWTCTGPEGRYTSLGDGGTALASACGCDTTPRW